jgi:hypothetical protein
MKILSSVPAAKQVSASGVIRLMPSPAMGPPLKRSIGDAKCNATNDNRMMLVLSK